MIIRTPLRLSLVGGGSDLRYFYNEFNGISLGFPIKKYNYVYLTQNIKEDIFQIVSDKENIETSNPNNIKDPLIREILRNFKINGQKIFIFSDLAHGTGLGSSSAMTVSLLNGINFLKNLKMNKTDIAEKAFEIEELCSGSTIGKQDHYMSSFGGINIFKYYKNKVAKVEKINLPKSKIINLEKSLILIRVGGLRNAAEILHDQKNNLKNNNNKIDNMKKLVSYVPSVKNAIINQDFKKLGNLINETWQLKKSFSKYISNNKVDELNDFLIKMGIYGGKLLGAGQSGYFMAVCNSKSKKKILSTFKRCDLIDVNIDQNGTSIVNEK